MPQRRTAKKDLKQNKKKQQRNIKTKQDIKSAVKKFKKTLEGTDESLRKQALQEMYKVFDKAASKKVIHKNKASRKKSRLSKLLTKAKSKPSK